MIVAGAESASAIAVPWQGVAVSCRAMDAAELRQRAAEIDWWHTMDLGHGVTTQGRGRTTKSLPRLHLPDRLDGQTVLDVGAWDGAFSFEAERRGATRVVSADIPRQDRRGFHLARE